MKNFLLILLIFIGGLVCGYVLNQKYGGPADNVAVTKADSSGDEGEISSQPPISQALYTQVLPKTSAMWLNIDLDRIREKGKPLAEFIEKESIHKVWSDFTASLPQGVTDVVAHIAGANREVRIFMLPPEEGAAHATWLLACKPLAPGISDASSETSSGDKKDSDSAPSLFETLKTAFPGATTSETKAGEQTLQVITTPTGDMAVTMQSGVTWMCNQTAALTKLWTLTPPAESLEKAPLYLALMEKHPDSIVSIFFNAPNVEARPMGAPGAIPQMMARAGVMQAALFYQWEDGAGRMTALATGPNPPPWVAQWKPLETFALPKHDPVGLLEAVVRWPAETPLSATQEISGATPSTEATPAGNAETKRERRERRMQRNLNKEGFQFSADLNVEEAKDKPKDLENLEERWGRSQSEFLSRLVPPGSTVGINFFGFYNGRPTLVFLFPDLESDKFLTKRLSKVPNLQPTPAEVAMLPGSLFSFKGHPFSRISGLEQMLVIDRDAVTYVFDEIEAAKFYLGEAKAPDSGKRDASIRKTLDNVRRPAQFQSVVSPDFFQYLIGQEVERLPKETPHMDELLDLVEEMKNTVQPMAISAGYAEPEWFLETYSSSQEAHLLDTALLGLAVYRFMGY